MNAKPISEQDVAAKGCGAVGGFAFGAIFFIAGVVFFWVVVVSPILLWNRAREWPGTEGTITRAELIVDSDTDGTSYRAEFDYQYEVNGKTYTNDRYSYLKIGGSRKRANQQLDRYPVGSQTTIYYDPSDPQDALMNRALGWGLLFGLIPTVFMLVGGGLMWWVVSGRHHQTIDRALEAASATADAGKPQPAAQHPGKKSKPPVFPDDLKDQEFDGPLKLKPEHNRLVVLAVVAGIAVFWNGIVGIFVYSFLVEGGGIFQRVFLGLFLTPFVLIGIAIIGFLFYTFLTLFNPTVEVALSNGAVPLGTEADLAWEFSGNYRRIRKLKIFIQGEESARYRQGTSTYTDHETFLEIPVVSTDSKTDIQFGSATIAIPDQTMHSVDTGDNQIKWTVEVRGDIPFWPDVTETLEFRVTP